MRGEWQGGVHSPCDLRHTCESRCLHFRILVIDSTTYDDTRNARSPSLVTNLQTCGDCVDLASQAFVKQELDVDEDGRVTAQDIFTFLRAQWVASSTRSSRPGALEGGSHRHTHRRRQTPQQAGLLATRKLPRGLQAKLLAAAG